MGFWGAVVGTIVGGPIGGIIGYEIGESIGGGKSTVNYGTPPDYSTAMEYLSDNNNATALAQIQSQQYALQQASLDREMQNAANLELGLERLDTKLQTAKMGFVQQMSAEENHHIEKIAEIKQKHAALESSGPRYVEIAPPEFFTDSF